MVARGKVFLIANVLLLLIFLFALGFLVYQATRVRINPTEAPEVLLVLISIAISAANFFLNLFIYYKYYPDGLIPGGTGGLHTVLTIFYLFSWGTLTYLIIKTILAVMEEEEIYRSPLTLLWIIFGFLMGGLLVLIEQFSLVRIIKRNNQNKVQDMIDNIGNTPNS